MATKKKVTKKSARKVSSVVASEAMASEMSTDTKTIIVVLLLIFVYPLGVIFMWIWMKWWPTWVKILLTLPILLCIAWFIFIMTMAGFIIRGAMTQQDRMNRMDYQRRIYVPNKQQNQLYLSTTPTPISY